MAFGRRPRKPTDGNGPDDPDAAILDALAEQLRAVVADGLDNATAPDDGPLADAARDYATAHGYDSHPQALRAMIRAALDSLGDGPAGDAARAVFGATTDTHLRPRAARRRIAADHLDITADTFRRNYEPRIRRDLAQRIHTTQHLPTTGPDPSLPDDDSHNGGDDQDPARTSLVLVYDADTADDHDSPAAPVRRTARVLALPSAARGQLGALVGRVPRYRWDKALLIPATAAVVWARWGSPAALRFAGVLVVAGLAVVGVEVVRSRSGTASTLQVLYERVPRIILLALAGVLIWNLTTASSHDDENSAVDDPCIGIYTAEECHAPAPAEPTTTVPNAVPTTYLDPGPVHPAECPLAGNEERRLAHDGVPPMCINPDHGYTATFATNFGDFDVALNASGAPATVNNFVYLARWHYYDGVALAGWPDGERFPDNLYTADPVATDDADQAPGYGMVLDQTPGAHPDDLDTVYMVAVDSGAPERMVFVVSPYAHNEAQGAEDEWPLVGVVNHCPDIITDPRPHQEGLSVRLTSVPIVIETITITEDTQPTTTTSQRHDDRCREEQAGLPQPEDLNPASTAPAGTR
jgi:hypothetical protein